MRLTYLPKILKYAMFGLIFGLSQILPVACFLQTSKVTVVEDITLQEQIYSVLPSCVYVEVEGVYEGWYGEDMQTEWAGSGVIISEGGLIVTAGHIVDGATKITVRLDDGREFEAVDWYKEDCTDLGLIKIDCNSLSFAIIGDSNKNFAGDPVFIIGCPLAKELFNTVTVGIVSAIKRDIDFFGEKLLLQVDGQAWPGNSGGGVFDINGKLIGILVGGYGRYDGISLCIPSNIVTLIINKYYAEQEMAEAR